MTVPPKRPGVYTQVLQPGDLRYTILIPEGYSDGTSVPLILALHYGGPMFPFKGAALLETLMAPALQELGAFMVAPDCPADHWANPQSEAGVLALLDHLQEVYSIDQGRTLLTGYSLGGAGTWYIAARNQARFAAALPISARPPADATEVRWQIPLYVIHARNDELFPFGSTDATVNLIRAEGASVHLVAVDGVTHFETYRFVAPLRAAVPWIKRVWKKSDSSRE